MNQPSDELKTLSEIRDIMERSSRFLSLSGMSGVFAGIFALIGVAVTYMHYGWSLSGDELQRDPAAFEAHALRGLYGFTMLHGVIILAASLAAGFYFTSRKARRQGLKMWDSTARRMAINLFIPLAAGGIFCLALMARNSIEFVVPATLLFYGLALINASKYTLGEIRYLGLCEIILGLLSSFIISCNLFFWAVGFGVLHIIYGWKMYSKYELTTVEE